MTVDLIEKIKPHQIYAAGDLADPHGTHKVCLDAIFEAVKILKEQLNFTKILDFKLTNNNQMKKRNSVELSRSRFSDKLEVVISVRV